MTLALAHLIDSMIEGGRIGSAAEAASLLGVTRARLSQVMRLLDLAPSIQELLLLGVPGSERALRQVAIRPCWIRQDEIATQRSK